MALNCFQSIKKGKAMAKATTESLLNELNDKNGLSYPDIGYSYFADVTGSGVYNPKVYTIVNENGGVARSHELNGATPRKRCDAIRKAIRG